MRLIWPVLAATLAVVSIAALALWLMTATELKRLQSEVRYPHDARFEAAAYREAASFEQQPVARLREIFRPITMTYNEKACVELRPRWNVYGGHTIYCFDRRSGALISKEAVQG